MRILLLILLAVVTSRPAYAQWIPKPKLAPATLPQESAFGSAVAVTPRFAAVGSTNEGAVYVFQRTTNGWLQEARLESSAGPFEQFGDALALEKDVLLVGRPAEDIVSFNSGAAYVFERGPTGWIEVAKLVPSDAFQLDNFGCAVALSGDTALIGAKYDDDLGTSTGSAYVFEKVGGGWVETAKLVANDGALGDLAGWSVALDGDVAVVGAWASQSTALFAGRAYVFERFGTVWIQTATLEASTLTDNQYFGISVAIEGDLIAVGATGKQPGVYLFQRVGLSWQETDKLSALGPQYGNAVSIDRRRVLVGALKNLGFGTAFLYAPKAGSWKLEKLFQPSDNPAGYGWSVAISGNEVLIGAVSGAAYPYRK